MRHSIVLKYSQIHNAKIPECFMYQIVAKEILHIAFLRNNALVHAVGTTDCSQAWQDQGGSGPSAIGPKVS